MAPARGESPAPWDAAPPHEQLFVLITGANSGVGLSIGERLIDEFLATRSLNSHLVLIPTTRSESKSTQTIRHLRAHAVAAAQTSKALASRAGGAEKYRWEDAASRVHVLSVQLDLCDIAGVYAFADRLCGQPLSNPRGLGEDQQDASLRGVRVPRLDSVVLNAAYGAWVGVNYPLAIWCVLTQGLVVPATWPTFKVAMPTALLNDRPAYKYPSKPKLGEVFCACVFGHYLLVRKLLPLLRRPRGPGQLPPGRIIWSSSVEATRGVFNPDDIQGLRTEHSYESSKRLTDNLSLSYTLPAVREHRRSFLTLADDEDPDAMVQPRMYVSHPGVLASTLFPLPWFLFWAYELVLVISRWLGSPWHTVDGYSGARSPAWLVLEEQDQLDAMGAERVKWGSSSDHTARSLLKRTEVEGWGWAGRVEAVDADEEGVTGVLRKQVGRRLDATDATPESLAEFEAVAADCWDEMEDLRQEWEEILEIS